MWCVNKYMEYQKLDSPTRYWMGAVCSLGIHQSKGKTYMEIYINYTV